LAVTLSFLSDSGASCHKQYSSLFSIVLHVMMYGITQLLVTCYTDSAVMKVSGWLTDYYLYFFTGHWGNLYQ